MRQHNYHYIRYALLIAFITALTQLPRILSYGIDITTFRILGIAITILVIVIDWRNYYLWNKEENKTGIGPVTVVISLFYFLVLFWFIRMPAPVTEHLRTFDELKVRQAQTEQMLDHLVKTNASYNAKLEEINKMVEGIYKNQFLQQKLEELDRMKANNLITLEDYNRKKEEILSRY